MKFIDRCRAGEFRNHLPITEEQRHTYLKASSVYVSHGVMEFAKETKEGKEEREALIAAGILPF